VLALRRERTPATGDALLLVHRGHTFGAPNVEGVDVLYLLESDGVVAPLQGVAWADWDARGRLLVAESTGALAIREQARGWANVWMHDLSGLTPDPRPAPAWASHW
jgi:hypothetical protein